MLWPHSQSLQQVHHAFDYQREVREWQAEQVERNHIVVRLEPIPGATPDLVAGRKRLDERLELTGLRQELDIRLESVPHLTTDERTTTFRRMVSRVGIPEDLDPSLKGAEDFAPEENDSALLIS